MATRTLIALPVLLAASWNAGCQDCTLEARPGVIVDVEEGAEAFEDCGAEITVEGIDGDFQPRRVENGVCSYWGLTERPGRFTLTVVAEGFEPEVRTVEVRESEDGCHVVSETISLTPTVPAPRSTGAYCEENAQCASGDCVSGSCLGQRADCSLADVQRAPGGSGWADSYSVDGNCFCATTFDHNIGGVLVETEVGTLTVREACELLGPGPGIEGHPIFNDVQCGNGPANDAGDEDWCPGRVDLGEGGCCTVGPTWSF